MSSESGSVIVAGGLIEKDNKYLLVQEANPKCYGKWNLPAGHLEVGETILEGAIREIKEETNCDVKLTGVCQIGNRKRTDLAFVSVIFTAKLLHEATAVTRPDEILDVKWFSYEEVIALHNSGSIRNSDLLVGTIENYRNGIVAPLELVKIYREGAEFQPFMAETGA